MGLRGLEEVARWESEGSGVPILPYSGRSGGEKVWFAKGELAFYEQALDTPGLGTLSFTVDRSHRTERHDICQKIHPLPPYPPQSTPPSLQTRGR